MSAPQQTFGTSYFVRAIHIFLNKTLHPIVAQYVSQNYRNPSVSITDYGHPARKSPSLHGRKSTPTPKFIGMAEKYFVCHIGPNLYISLIYAFHWVFVVPGLNEPSTDPKPTACTTKNTSFVCQRCDK